LKQLKASVGGTTDLPKCETTVDLKFTLKVTGQLQAAVASADVSYKIGECSVKTGCHWDNQWSASYHLGLTGLGARLSVIGEGEAFGKLRLF
jgi:hypothetical protein